jgi:hypothetical protein
LESQRARAVFSTQDGGRWLEFLWKDGNVNFLPEQGVFASAGRVDVRESGDTLEFTGRGWKRSVRLVEAELTVEQTTPLPADGLAAERRGNVGMTVARPSPATAVIRLAPAN